MLKIVIQNPQSETVINNIDPEELSFWTDLLDSCPLQGEIKILDAISGTEYHVA